MPKSEVTTRTGTDLTQHVNAQLRELLIDAPIEGEGDGSARLIATMLDAESLSDIADVFSGMDNSESVANRQLMINGFVIRESGYEGGLGIYATVYATDLATKKNTPFNSSAMSIIALLLMAHRRDWFPFTAHVESKTIGKSGNTVYNLIPGQ